MSRIKIDNPDVIIVGSGAGGSTAARVLTNRGFKVLILEKGPEPTSDDFLPYDELHFEVHENLTPKVSEDPNIYMRNDSPVRQKRWWIANMAGGATRIWDANFPRYTEEDMSMLSLMKGNIPLDASIVDWPWTYEEFQKYFQMAEHDWGVSGQTNQSPSQESFQEGYNFPMPPVRQHASSPFIKSIFNESGWHPYLGAKAVNSRTYDGRPGYAFSGFFAGFGDPVNDRASAYNTMLPKAYQTGNCEIRFGSYVTRVLHKKGAVQGVCVLSEQDGAEQEITAPIVIVSIQAVQSARLFLLSDFPNTNTLIGKYLTYHTKGGVVARFPGISPWDGGIDGPYQPRTGIGSLEIRDIYWIDDNKTYLTKGGKFASFDPYTTSTPIELVGRIRKWGKPLQEELMQLRSKAGIGFSFTGEALSKLENRVELDPDVKDKWGIPVARTYYEHHQYDLDLSRYAIDRISRVLVDGGAEIISKYYQSKSNSGYGHNHGSLRAGIDPETSVLNPDCESHEVAGLYVLDAAFMPTSGASNPTLTVLANAYRVTNSIPHPRNKL